MVCLMVWCDCYFHLPSDVFISKLIKHSSSEDLNSFHEEASCDMKETFCYFVVVLKIYSNYLFVMKRVSNTYLSVLGI